MNIIITMLGLFKGGYMLLDGIFVIVMGEYIGLKKPGLWAEIFYKMNIDVFKLDGFLFCMDYFGLFGFMPYGQTKNGLTHLG